MDEEPTHWSVYQRPVLWSGNTLQRLLGTTSHGRASHTKNILQFFLACLNLVLKSTLFSQNGRKGKKEFLIIESLSKLKNISVSKENQKNKYNVNAKS